MKEKTINFLKQNWFKILAIVFLLGALGDNPYVYYQLLRWAILVIGAYLAYLAYNNGKNFWAWVFGITALLFNPIIPFYFSRNVWQFVDVVVAAIFIISIFIKHERKN